jgi:hypothetical protein
LSAAIAHRYVYTEPSALGCNARGPELHLATCSAAREHPHFFSGRLREPRLTADLLLALTEVVRTHFWQPRPVLLDPVVTASAAVLRLEGFSGCCGVYARVDLAAESFDAEILGRGTTNVDFNDPMRTALARLHDEAGVELAVGRGEVRLTRDGDAVVEKKVRLPVRWVKGFSEVQAYQPRLAPRLELSGAEARRLLRELPRAGAPKAVSWLVPGGGGPRLSQRPTAGAVRVAGLHRLRVLAPLLGRARGLRIWAEDASGTSAWQLDLGPARFFLMLSPEVQRGFSGEGQVLESLAAGDWETALPRVRAELNWQSELDPERLATRTGLAVERIEQALAALGARGLAGYDLERGRYFHRELPFDLERVESLQPRLLEARALLAAGGVSPTGDAEYAVRGTEVVHRVRLPPEGERCTCPWFSKHQGARGPCKHILAARLLRDGED